VLFGSAARGTMGPNNDIDLLVIKGGKFHYWRLLTNIYRQLPGTAVVDVVLATPEDVERYRDTNCLVICPALREGKVIYDSHSSPRHTDTPTNGGSAAGKCIPASRSRNGFSEREAANNYFSFFTIRRSSNWKAPWASNSVGRSWPGPEMHIVKESLSRA